jgi:HlyD family secretion protein
LGVLTALNFIEQARDRLRRRAWDSERMRSSITMGALKKLRSSLLLIAIAAAVGGSIQFASGRPDRWPWERTRPLVERYRFAPVSRTVLAGSITAAGQLESSKKTVIECELENISVGVKGQRLDAGGASVLLSLVPDGSVVQEGDVLARLDSSDYEELLRQQQITVERARADRAQAAVDLEVAKLAVFEYKEGVMKETFKDYQRAIALAESDQMRCKDRLDWTLRMEEKGYAPKSQVATEKQNYAKALFAAAQERGALKLFQKHTAPRALIELEGEVIAGTAMMNYQDSRLTRHLGRLAKLEKQVENCTIRAPHDGFVIYANNPRRGIVIEEGMSVRQRQDLFYLPDLKKMEVVTLLHESIVDQVRKGMRATVSLEGAPDARLSGLVTKVLPIPEFDYWSDVRYFKAIVTLDSVSRVDLKPGMTAQVEMFLDPKPNVLTVPVEAVTQEDDGDFCYVARNDRLERRKIELGQATHDLLEIADGLEEGEQVVLNPVQSGIDADLVDRSEPTTKTASPPTRGDKVAADPVNAVAVLH